jgi:Rv0078B-related antitoxin
MDLAEQLDALERLESKTPAEKLREALELYDEGLVMQRLVFARRHPEQDAEALEKRLHAWLRREGETLDGG